MKNTIIFENYNEKSKTYEKSRLDFNNEPTILDFLKKTNLSKYFTKVADIVSDKNKNPKYSVNFLQEFLKVGKNGYYTKDTDHSQWVYLLSINGKIIKIGESNKTLGNRWGSYGAGTRENRNNGTCSTTNYFISEIIRQSLNSKYKIELFGYRIPNVVIKIDVFGTTKKVITNNVKSYESSLIEKFVNLYGKKPIVGKNGLVK